MQRPPIQHVKWSRPISTGTTSYRWQPFAGGVFVIRRTVVHRLPLVKLGESSPQGLDLTADK